MLQKLLEKIKNRETPCQLNLVLSDATKLPFQDSSFDILMLVHVLHLIKDWQRAILEAKRVLKPDGIFVMGNHNIHALESSFGQKYMELCRKYSSTPNKLFRYVLEGFFQVCKKMSIKMLKN